MAKRTFHASNYTPTAQADTSALTNATYQALRGGSGSQIIAISDIYINGLAATSSPTNMQLARSSTIATTPTALAANNSDGPNHPATATLTAAPVSFVAASTGPQRSAATSDAKMELGLNAFGGVVRIQLPPGSEWWIVGNTTSGGESILSAFTGGTVGNVNSHLVYEPY